MTMKSKSKSPTTATKRSAKRHPDDIATLVLRDHKPIKELILILKDPEVSLSKKHTAFMEFEPMLSSHARAEEETLYDQLKDKDKTRIEALEGDSEHEIADRLMNEIKQITGDDDLWMAKVKVLAEIVDHHVKEEEKDVLKDTIKSLSTAERAEVGAEYSRLLSKYRGDRETSAKAKDKGKLKTVESRADHF